MWLDGGGILSQPSPVLYADHVAGGGVELFNARIRAGMEGIVAKLKAWLGGNGKDPAEQPLKTRLREILGK